LESYSVFKEMKSHPRNGAPNAFRLTLQGNLPGLSLCRLTSQRLFRSDTSQLVDSHNGGGLRSALSQRRDSHYYVGTFSVAPVREFDHGRCVHCNPSLAPQGNADGAAPGTSKFFLPSNFL
jgi:hypothetical protein